VATVTLRGKLHYVNNDSRLGPCPCEPPNPGFWVLLALCAGGPPDTNGATTLLQNANWHEGDCAEVRGTWVTIGVNVKALCLDPNAQFITPCPIGPCP
jgi:hypothetical protein